MAELGGGGHPGQLTSSDIQHATERTGHTPRLLSTVFRYDAGHALRANTSLAVSSALTPLVILCSQFLLSLNLLPPQQDLTLNISFQSATALVLQNAKSMHFTYVVCLPPPLSQPHIQLYTGLYLSPPLYLGSLCPFSAQQPGSFSRDANLTTPRPCSNPWDPTIPRVKPKPNHSNEASCGLVAADLWPLAWLFPCPPASGHLGFISVP